MKNTKGRLENSSIYISSHHCVTATIFANAALLRISADAHTHACETQRNAVLSINYLAF